MGRSSELNLGEFFCFFPKTRTPGHFLETPMRAREYSYAEEPSFRERHSLLRIFGIINILFGEGTERATEIKGTFLRVLNTEPVQRLNRLSQLGMIQMPVKIISNSFADGVEDAWMQSGLIEMKQPGRENIYLGAKRYRHILKVSEIVAKKCSHMFLNCVPSIPKDFAINYIMGGFLHDLGHPVLSHKGELAIAMALADPDVQKSSPADIISLAEMDHEHRALELINNTKIHDILIDAGFNLDLIKDIILEKRGSLQDADPAAYLSDDLDNMAGHISDMKVNERLIDSIVSTTIWDKSLREESITQAGIQPRLELLRRRKRTYENVYRQPDISRMEIQIALGLSMMVKAGHLSVEELLRGDDETIQLKALETAKKHGTKYKAFTDAVEAILFPHVIPIHIDDLNDELRETMQAGIVAFQVKLRELLLERETTSLEQCEWYSVLPYNFSQKTLLYGNEIKIHDDSPPGISETQVLLCFSDSVSEEIREKILRLVSKSAEGGVEREAKWLFETQDRAVFKPFEDKKMWGKFKVNREPVWQRDLYIWAENLGTSRETYLRLRETHNLGIAGEDNRRVKYKISYKLPYPMNNENGFLNRGEKEVEIAPEEFQRLVEEPELLFTTANQDVTLLLELFRKNHKSANLTNLGWVNNLRTRLILEESGRRCEIDLDRIIYSLEDLSYQDALLKGFNEFELELEQFNLKEQDLLELRDMLDGLASRSPTLMRRIDKSKLYRMRRIFNNN